jgi:hypothetical protein
MAAGSRYASILGPCVQVHGWQVRRSATIPMLNGLVRIVALARVIPLLGGFIVTFVLGTGFALMLSGGANFRAVALNLATARRVRPRLIARLSHGGKPD